MTPEPIRPSFFGTAPMRSAPSLLRIFSSSKSAPGSARALEPVATMTCLPVSTSSPTLTCQASAEPPTKLPRPWKKLTLFFLNRYRMPSLFCFTTLSLRASIFLTSMLRSFRPMPWSAKCFAACSKFSLDCSSALLGMQPTLVQVPPSAGPPAAFFHSSMQATLRPSCAARIAAM
jgi:hypothetical protein